jgi:hypothetical protein
MSNDTETQYSSVLYYTGKPVQAQYALQLVQREHFSLEIKRPVCEAYKSGLSGVKIISVWCVSSAGTNP